MFVEVCEINAKPPLPISFSDHYWICQPCRMQYSSDQTSSLKFLDLFRNKLLPLQGLLPDFLFERSGVWEDSKLVLDYLPGNTGDIRWLLGKHIDIRP